MNDKDNEKIVFFDRNYGQKKQKKHKRDSVPCRQGDCHFSRSVVADRLKQPTLPTRTSSPQTSVYLVLQPIRFTPRLCRHNLA